MARKERSIILENVMESGGITNSLYLETASTIYSRSFRTDDVLDIGIAYLMTTVNVSAAATVVFQHSFQRPTTEGVVDVSYSPPVGLSSHIGGLTTTSGVWTYLPLFTGATNKLSMPFGRFMLLGTGWNSGSTVLIKLAKRYEG